MTHEASKWAGCLIGNMISLFSIQDVDSITSIIFAVVGCLITVISGVIVPIVRYCKSKKTNDDLNKLKDDLDKFNDEHKENK